MIMDPVRRKQLEELAQRRLDATADDEEQFSFLFRTEGSFDYRYCPWWKFEEEDFDGWVQGLDLPWSESRRQQLESGEADPDETELRQWRRAMCRQQAEDGEAFIAYIVPMVEDKGIEGFAVFLVNLESDDPPMLDGVFDSVNEAMAALRADGVVVEENRKR